MSNIGKQIRKRRAELGITQEELASKLNYKSKTTIAKIENGTNDIVQSKVIEFAKALETTPAYLMGWNDETIEFKYNTLSSSDSENLNKYVDYLYMRERELIADANFNEYIEFIVAEKVRQLSDTGKKKVSAYTTKLLDVEVADKELNAAHARTDIDVTEDMIKHDDDIMDDDDF